MLRAVHGIADPVAQLDALGRAYIAWGTANSAYYQLMFMQRTDFLLQGRPGDTQPRIAAFQVLQQVVEAAMAAGLFQPGDPEQVSTALWAMVHGIVALRIAMPTVDPVRIEAATEVALAMARRGLRPV